MSPAISVLLPFRDAGRWLEAAARSILDDGFVDLELLLLDDGSRDSGPQIAADLCRQDPRARLMTGPPRGIVETLNRGLAEARAPFIGRMDGDDVSLPGRFAAQLCFLDAHPEVGVVDGRVTCFRDDGPLLGGMAAFEAWLDTLEDAAAMRANLLVDSPLVHPAVLARRQVLLDVGAYLPDGPEDYGLWLRVVGAGWDLHKLPRPVLRWRDHGARLTRTDPRYARGAFVSLKWDFLTRFGGLDPGRRVVVWGAGKEARPWLRRLREGGFDVVGVLDIDPHKQGTTRHGYPTYPLEALDTLRWDLCLVAVGARGAREEIRAKLVARGVAEAPPAGQRGFWCLA